MPIGREPQTTESRLHEAVLRFNAGEQSAVEDLFSHVRHRLMVITRRKLHGPGGFATVARWYATDDVVQEACLQLAKTLEQEQINSGDHFLRLAAIHIRRALLNIHAHTGTKSHFSQTASTDPADNQTLAKGAVVALEAGTDSGIRWEKFLDHFKTLTEEQRQMLDDVFFNGCTQQETAARMQIGITAFKQRWLKLKLQLFDEGFSPFN